MSARKPSFQKTTTTVSQELSDTAYDNVKVVSTNIDDVNYLADNMTELLAVSGDAQPMLDAAAAALASEQAAAISETNANNDAVQVAADLVATDLDTIATAADRVQTGLDVLSTAADVLLTAQDAIDTAQDSIDTNADKLVTNADATQTALDRIQTALDRTAVANDLVQTNQDTIDTAADLATTNQNAIDTAADRVQTGLDRVATGQDLAATAQDVIDTGADLAQTTLDKASTAADRVQTGLDAISTAADLVATNQDTIDTANDLIQTAQDVIDSNAAKDAAIVAQGLSESARDSAVTAADLVDDLVLGAFTTALEPVTSSIGAIYYNTDLNQLKVWNGTAWDDAAFSTVGTVTSFNTREGAIILSAADINSAMGFTVTDELTGLEVQTLYEAQTNKVIDEVTSLQLAGGTGTQGTMTWNADEETADLVLNGAVLQMGQETHLHCKNSTGSTITNGTVVMATGTLGASGRITIAPWDGTSAIKYILGVATTDITAGSDGKVTTFGKVRGLDTSAFAEGDILYATAGGGLTTVAPVTGVHAELAIVINVHANAGTIMVRFTPIDINLFEPIDGTILKDADIDVTVQSYDSNTTIQGNTFNGANQLLQLDGDALVPAGNLPSYIDADTLDGIDSTGFGTAAAVALNTAKETNVTTDLSTTYNTTQVTIVSSDGSDAVINEANSSTAGVISVADHDKLAGISAGATVDQDLSTLAVKLSDQTIAATEALTISGTSITLTKGDATTDVIVIPDGVTDHTLLSNIGTNTHSQIDTHLGDTTTHFTEGSITLTTSQITGLDTALGNKLETSLKGSSNGIAELDGSGLVPSSQLPGYVDDVLEYANFAGFPGTGESGKVYIAVDTNITYRWSGSVYTQIGSDLALGETISTAYRGDRGKIAYDHSQVSHDKTLVGLGNVDNTSDSNKPVSTSQQTALDFKAPIASPTFTGTVSGVTKSMVGLSNVDNTTDALKPISTATQSALDLLESKFNINAAKELAGMNIADMVYTTGTLTKIVYEGTNNFEDLTYGADGLSNIAHTVNNILAGNTVLTYVTGDLDSVTFTSI